MKLLTLAALSATVLISFGLGATGCAHTTGASVSRALTVEGNPAAARGHHAATAPDGAPLAPPPAAAVALPAGRDGIVVVPLDRGERIGMDVILMERAAPAGCTDSAGGATVDCVPLGGL